MPRTLIDGNGEMARRIRAHDWAATPIGPIEGWSETLIATVNLMLHSPFPTILSWGPEMVFLYNDAGIPTLAGKHPEALGGLYHEVFREAWDLVSDDLEACFVRGETPVRDNMFIPILLNGVVEDHYWNYSLIPVYENGRIVGIYDAYRNTTDVVMGVRRLRESEARLKLATEVAQLGIFVWDVGTGVASWENDRMYEIFGRTWEQGPLNAEMFMTEVVHPDSLGTFQEAVEATTRTGETFHFEGMIRRMDDMANWIEITGHIEAGDDGAPGRMLGTVRDVTHIKKSEAALRTAEKLGAVGKLAASIAHEINNPLESVTNLLYLSQTSDDPEQIRMYLDIAERELRRVSVISNQTLRFYRQSSYPTVAWGRDLLDGVLSIYQGRLVNSKIEVQRRIRATQPVMCFEGEIRQVLNNLVGNAIDAMAAGGGRLLVRTRTATNWHSGGKGLVLTVADTGEGMSATVMKRIFEPFFTTKGMSGTGLGLWVCEDIVKRHRGVLRVRSRRGLGGSATHGSGTAFTLFLPFDGVEL
jgi:PAS domain S-box-containing protein